MVGVLKTTSSPAREEEPHFGGKVQGTETAPKSPMQES
jgi:hypothetical protein